MEQVVKFSSSVIRQLQKESLREGCVFIRCCLRLTDENNVHFWGKSKKELVESTGLSVTTVTKSLSQLALKGFITKVGKGEYYINKKFAQKFWVKRKASSKNEL